MKKIFSIIILVIINIYCYSQKSKELFDTLSFLLPERQLPFILSYDINKCSDFVLPLKKIPIAIANEFVCSQGISCQHGCDKRWYYGLLALGKISLTTSNKFFMFAFDLSAGCGEKAYIITYSQEGKMIDTLFFYGWGYISKPSELYKWGETYHLEAKIDEKMIITIYKKERLGKELMEGGKIKRREKRTTYKYRILDDGRFYKMEEKVVKDEFSFYE